MEGEARGKKSSPKFGVLSTALKLFENYRQILRKSESKSQNSRKIRFSIKKMNFGK